MMILRQQVSIYDYVHTVSTKQHANKKTYNCTDRIKNGHATVHQIINMQKAKQPDLQK